MIDHVTIEKVMETSNSQIVEVVTEYITLKRRGINYIGNCPFHNEKTPSFIVSPHKGIYKCFGCGKGGNAVNFVMDHDQVSFPEAIKQLGAKFNIQVEEEEVSPEQLRRKNERESMMVVSEYAGKFFMKNLHETDEGKSVGLSYFRSRGFRDDIISKFQLGYSPEKRDALSTNALQNGYKIEFLEKTGLSIVRDDYKADRFRGRVMFPIHSLSGKTIAFGGRILKTDVKTAKYLNSPESDIYHKSKVLYGIFQAKQEISREDSCYLVEGYTDVLSFHQSGISNVVASSGTALTVDQIRLIARFTKNITIIYDGDPAGIKASLRGIDLVLTEGMNVKILLLPEGEDPDSFAKQRNEEVLKAYINEHQTDFIKFKTSLLLQDAKNDPIKRAQLIQDIVRSIATIPDSIIRSVYVKECSVLLNVNEPVLYSEIDKLKKARFATEQKRQPAQTPTSATSAPIPQQIEVENRYDLEEREVLKYLIKYGEVILTQEEGEDALTVGNFIINELREDELHSVNPLYNKVLDLYEKEGCNNPSTALKFFVNNADMEMSQLASDLIGREYELSKIHKRFSLITEETDKLKDLVPKVVAELKWKKVKVLLEQKRQNLKLAESSGDSEKLMEVMQDLVHWQQAMKHVSQLQGGRTIV